VKLVLSWVKDAQSRDDISNVQKVAVDLVKERASELGRQEWMDNPWGISLETQARRNGA
jgi:hypothetical protein